jgi:hypothetical protein
VSTRTIIEINHDCLRRLGPEQWAELMAALSQSFITGKLNQADGSPVQWIPGIRILAQRHHSETLHLKVE